VADLGLSLALHAVVLGLVALSLPGESASRVPLVYRVDLVPAPRPAPPRPVPQPERPAEPPKETQARPRMREQARPLPRADQPTPQARREPAIEPRPADPAPAAPALGPVQLEGEVRVADPYLRQIVTRIHRGWRNARSAGAARCVVYFRIVADGRVEGIRIESGSGSAAFDRAALGAVKRVGRFQPLPPTVRDRALGVHFEFRQEG